MADKQTGHAVFLSSFTDVYTGALIRTYLFYNSLNKSQTFTFTLSEGIKFNGTKVRSTRE